MSAQRDHGGHEAVVQGVAEDGSQIHVSLSSADLLDQLEERWPPIGLGRADSSADVAMHLDVSRREPDGAVAVLVDGVASPGSWDRVESELALFTATHLERLVAIHAGAVRWGEAVLLFPGPSRAGKSTLCMAAHAAGAEVLTDEYALVDPRSGLLSGWRRPVRVRAEACIERHDLTVDHEPVRADLVAVLEHRSTTVDDPTRHDWHPVPPSQTVLGLLANTVCARTRPDDSLDAALAIARNAITLEGVRGEAAAAISELFRLLQRA